MSFVIGPWQDMKKKKKKSTFYHKALQGNKGRDCCTEYDENYKMIKMIVITHPQFHSPVPNRAVEDCGSEHPFPVNIYWQTC